MAKLDSVMCNTDKRILFLSDAINNETICEVCFNLLYLVKYDDDKECKEIGYTRTPISIYINSNGGNIYDMWALIDIIENSKTPIYTYCTGYAMSAAFMIFLAGHKRFCSKHATFMTHQMRITRSGEYQKVVEGMEETEYMTKTMEQFIIEKTKITQHELDIIREKKIDRYFHAEEASKYGIVTEII